MNMHPFVLFHDKRSLLMVCFALLLLCTVAIAAPEQGARSGNNAESFGVERADRVIRAAMKERRIPGLQVAVIQHNKVAFLHSYGTANLETPVPVTNNTVFSINSMTKSFTGIAVMQLVQEGKVDLAASISTYLNDLPEAWRAVTIRQLLSHTSGLPNFINNNGGYPNHLPDEQSAWKWVLTQPMMFAPGERFWYCQTNYALLQKVLEKFRGESYPQIMQQRVFDPAGMQSTSFGDSYDLTPNKAPSYGFRNATPGNMGVLKPSIEEFGPLHRAASGINSTAEDMARWIIALNSGKLLNAQTRDILWTPVAYNGGKVGQWALGWIAMNAGNHRGIGMTGGGRAAFVIYPDDDIAVVVLSNLAGGAPEDFLDEIAVCFSKTLTLSPISALREAVAGTDYSHVEEAAAAYRRAHPNTQFGEFSLNDWGYRLLKGGEPAKGLAVIKLEAALYPTSGNAFDSLGEAYALNHQTQLAIESYQKSLKLDPANENAKAWRERLR